MLSAYHFNKCMNTLLTFAEVQVNKEKSRAWYEFLKNDFEDDEFSKICHEICKTEVLFGHYPALKLFYERKKEDASGMVFIQDGVFYIDDTIPEYKEHLKGMSDEDIERCWKWIRDNKYGEFVSKEWIIERIKQFKPINPALTSESICEAVKLLTKGVKNV